MRTSAAAALATVALLIGLALGIGIAPALSQARASLTAGAPAARQMPPPLAVSLETAARDDVPAVYQTLGSLRSADVLVLRPPEAGVVRALPIADGQEVAADTVILQLDDEREQAVVTEARVAHEEAERQLQVASGLSLGATVSEDERARLRSQVAAAAARLAQAEAQLARRTLRAPFPGTLGLVAIELGASVDAGTPVAELVRLDPLRISAAVPERYLSELQQTRALRALLPDGTRQEISLVYSAPQLDPATRTLRVEAALPNPTRQLRPGMSVRVEVLLAAQEGVISIPEEAVVFEGNRSYVYVATDTGQLPPGAVGAAMPRDLVLGTRAAGRVVVEQGLEQGERIIVRGVQKIFMPGMPVADAAARQSAPESSAAPN